MACIAPQPFTWISETGFLNNADSGNLFINQSGHEAIDLHSNLNENPRFFVSSPSNNLNEFVICSVGRPSSEKN